MYMKRVFVHILYRQKKSTECNVCTVIHCPFYPFPSTQICKEVLNKNTIMFGFLYHVDHYLDL